MTRNITQGVHHVGLAVPDLDAAYGFFTNVLGFAKAGEVPDYPAIFVSDGRHILAASGIGVYAGGDVLACQASRRTRVRYRHRGPTTEVDPRSLAVLQPDIEQPRGRALARPDPQSRFTLVNQF
jgi:catechol 2,3-dioxygenase-like lactoylglutathione lyase family enzyme